MNSKLTLNLGIRYDYTTPLYDKYNQIANLDFATGQLVLAGQNGASRGLVTTDKDDFAPRLGLAWQVRSNTVLRAGYGRFFSAQELRPAIPSSFTTTFRSLSNPTTSLTGLCQRSRFLEDSRQLTQTILPERP